MVVPLISKHLLSSYYLLGAVIRTGDRVINKSDQNPCLRGAHILIGETNNNNIQKSNTQYVKE